MFASSVRSRWVPAIVIGVTVVVIGGAVALADLATLPDEPTPSPSHAPSHTPSQLPSRVPSATPGPSPMPSTLPGAHLPLGELAWWNVQAYGYGYVEPPPPGASPLPEGGNLLTVGTLGGTISAEMTLNEAWSHWYVSGPVGTDVLVANDDGSRTSVFTISALDGTRTDLFATSDLVPAASLSPDGATVYYIRLDRSTGADSGLWSQPRAGGAERQVLAGPIGEPFIDPIRNDVTVWHLRVSPSGRATVVQWCSGGVRCRTVILDLASGRQLEAADAAWPVGITDDDFMADGGGSRRGEIVAVDLATGMTRTVAPGAAAGWPVRLGDDWQLAFAGDPSDATWLVGIAPGSQPSRVPEGSEPDRPGTELRLPNGHFGAVLPDGWIIRWFDSSHRDAPFPAGYVPGQLVNVVTGERVDLGPFAGP